MLVEANSVSKYDKGRPASLTNAVQIWKKLQTCVALFDSEYRQSQVQNSCASTSFKPDQTFEERFIDKILAKKVREEVQRYGIYEGEAEMDCQKKECVEWHNIKVQRLYDPAASSHIIFMHSDSIATYKNALNRLKEVENEIQNHKIKDENAASKKAQFLAILSHELRTPINGVVGMTDMLADTRLDDTQKDYVDTCRLSCRFLLTILDDINSIQKFETNENHTEDGNKEAFSIISTLKDAVFILSSMCEEKEMDIKVDIELQHVNYLGDSATLTTILLNLITNAIKFSHTNKLVEVRVTRKPEKRDPDSSVPAQGQCLLFEVEDHGLGIEKEHHDKIYDDFYMADKGLTRKAGGNGMGLTIAKHFVNKLGGEIWFNTESCIGTTFYFTFYAIPHSPEADNGGVSSNPSEFRTSFCLSSLRHEKATPDTESPSSSPVSSTKPRTRFLSDASIHRYPVCDRQHRSIAMPRSTHSVSIENISPISERRGSHFFQIETQKKLIDIAVPEERKIKEPDVSLDIKKNENCSNVLVSVAEKEDIGTEEVTPSIDQAQKTTPKQMTRRKKKRKKKGKNEKDKKKEKKKEKLSKTLPLKILVTDDSVINIKVATHFLQKLG